MGYITNEGVWLNKAVYDEAERKYYEGLYSTKVGSSSTSSAALEIAKAREQIGKTLKSGMSNASGDSLSRISTIEEENKMLLDMCGKLESMMVKLEQRVATLESSAGTSSVQSTSKDCSNKVIEEVQEEDDIDLFGSDEEDNEAAEAIKKERLAAYAAKKSKKPALIAKSSVLLDVKPWDDETNMSELEKSVRKISMDGLVWGASKFVPLAYGIKKMSIMCTVEDDKVSIEELSEKIEALEDFVQSVDIAAFNKV